MSKMNSRVAGVAIVVLFLFISQSKNVWAKDALEKEKGEAEPAKPAVGLTGIELEELETDFEPEIHRLIIPPYYEENKGHLRLRLFFPLFFLRERSGKGARTDLGIFPFYWRYREGQNKADVYFPLYWRFRKPGFKTDIVLQTHYNRSEHGYNFGFSPVFYFGKNTDEKTSYQVVPPLFWRFVDEKSSFLLAGIYYDKREKNDFDLGLPPLFFSGRNRYKTYTVVLPPLFWRFTDDIAYTTKNVIPPFFYNTREFGYSFGAIPLLYIARDKNWDRTLITPFYYGSRWPHKNEYGELLGEGKSYYFPLFLSYYKKAPGLSQGGLLFFYHWYWNQGDYLKMFSPLVWTYGNKRTFDDSLLIPPLFYHRSSPVRDDLMVGLIYWNFHQHYKDRILAIAPLFAHKKWLYERHFRTWVFPTFDFGVTPKSYHVRLHPIFYLGKDETSDHLVFAPLLWKFRDEEDDDLVVFPFYWSFSDLVHKDSSKIFFPFWWQFDNPKHKKKNRVAFPFYWDSQKGLLGKRTTVAFPLFWRSRDPERTTTGILNMFLNKGAIKGNPFWTFNIFPVLGFGSPPASSGAYWSILGGLAGWRRQGSSKQLKLLWIPFNF